jgi:hypothetical protein
MNSLQEWSEGSYIASYIERFDRYFRKKGWFGLSAEEEDSIHKKLAHATTGDSNTSATPEGKQNDDGLEAIKGGSAAWSFTSGGSRVVVEVATAYAITKAMMPLRIALSLWATPWFARNVVANVGYIAVYCQKRVYKALLKKPPRG